LEAYYYFLFLNYDSRYYSFCYTSLPLSWKLLWVPMTNKASLIHDVLKNKCVNALDSLGRDFPSLWKMDSEKPALHMKGRSQQDSGFLQ
jgi:hypothetical protein